ncbi:hypothetical protein K3495_g8434 [Podosphaera aphanis]|nr:hypothetical protein K3495_g8434 [Podosphaera aphanis]
MKKNPLDIYELLAMVSNPEQLLPNLGLMESHS